MVVTVVRVAVVGQDSLGKWVKNLLSGTRNRAL